MVLLGGLEIVAAGYVLNELSKDNKKSGSSSSRPSSQPAQHHRKRRDSSNRPRPSQQNLMPPQHAIPSRPTSAPPQQFVPARINSVPPVYGQSMPMPGPTSAPMAGPALAPGSHLGPSWMNQNQPFTPTPQAQTWPQQPPQPPQPQQQHYQQPYQQPQQQPQHQQHTPYPPQQQPQQPQQQYHQRQQQPPPPYQSYSQSTPQLSSSVPGSAPALASNSAYAGTQSQMYFDTKTGKWQAGMLPAELPGSNAREISDGSKGSSHGRGRSRRDRAYSSGSDSYSDGYSDMAYGSLPGSRSRRH